jgi:hypothetical protein
MNWIKMSEREPPKDICILIWLPLKELCVVATCIECNDGSLCFSKDGFCTTIEPRRITHWAEIVPPESE